MLAGWRLGLVGVGIIFMGNLMLFVTHTGTKEFMIGMIMAIIHQSGIACDSLS